MAEQIKAEPRRIVRVAGTDLDGTLAAERALRKIFGIGFMTAKAFCTAAGVDGKKKVGFYEEAQVKALEAAIVGQASMATLPKWMINRRHDPETGKDMHVVGDKLKMNNSEDINLMKRTRIYKGVRHELGLPVRGQRTRSTGRRSSTVGVVRAKAAAAAKPAAAPSAAAGKAAAAKPAAGAPTAKPAAAPTKK
jgi:small subunit ribosomal protein S13